MINSFDIFAEFYNRIKESESMADIIKEYGGANIYVPSYKGTFRNYDILKDYEEGIKLGKQSPVVIREIATKHNLSYNSVCTIIKEIKA